jgi:hypothetical protein
VPGHLEPDVSLSGARAHPPSRSTGLQRYATNIGDFTEPAQHIVHAGGAHCKRTPSRDEGRFVSTIGPFMTPTDNGWRDVLARKTVAVLIAVRHLAQQSFFRDE